MENKTVKVAFIGAGQVNFGGHGNAWDHASRLERMPNVSIVGIADINTTRASEVLERRLIKHKDIWSGVKIYSDYREMIKETSPDAIIIGLPPNVHGSMERPVELDCVNAGVHILVEKPISCTPPELMQDFHKDLIAAEQRGTIISVAYMFRYSKVMLQMKQLAESFGPIRYFNARYNCAYSNIMAPFWWNVQSSGGPIIEQATHFADLARFFCGEIDYTTFHVNSIGANEPMGQLSEIKVDENSIPMEHRINRVTSALWKFENGAVGNLTHTALLHGWKYELQIEIFGDGYYIYVHDPYNECKLTVRRPGSEQEEITTVPDDPYMHEMETFIEAVRTKDKSKIASSYADAFKTYELTWAIQRACNAKKPTP